MENILPIIVGAAMVLAGPMIISYSRRTIRTAKAAQNWPTVEGEIKQSSVEEFGTHPVSYTCNISYDYEIDGAKHEANRVSFFGIFTLEEATSFTQQFPAGSRHPVYYNPSNPTFSVLVPGVYGKNRSHGAAIGVLVSIAGIGVIAGATM